MLMRIGYITGHLKKRFKLKLSFSVACCSYKRIKKNKIINMSRFEIKMPKLGEVLLKEPLYPGR